MGPALVRAMRAMMAPGGIQPLKASRCQRMKLRSRRRRPGQTNRWGPPGDGGILSLSDADYRNIDDQPRSAAGARFKLHITAQETRPIGHHFDAQAFWTGGVRAKSTTVVGHSQIQSIARAKQRNINLRAAAVPRSIGYRLLDDP